MRTWDGGLPVSLPFPSHKAEVLRCICLSQFLAPPLPIQDATENRVSLSMASNQDPEAQGCGAHSPVPLAQKL